MDRRKRNWCAGSRGRRIREPTKFCWENRRDCRGRRRIGSRRVTLTECTLVHDGMPPTSTVVFPEESSAWKRFLQRAWRYSRRTVIVLAALGVILGVGRIALPFYLRHAINARLAKVPAYEGRVDEVSVAVWRGAYALEGVRILKRGVNGTEPFFAAQEIDFSLAWRELLRRKIVADIVLVEAELNLVKAPSAAQSQLEADRRWQSVIEDIFPISITHLKIEDSRLHYTDETAEPKVDLYVNHLTALATGLQNRPADEGQEFPATLTAEGDSIGHGRLFVAGRGEPLAERPHFELTLRLERVSLPTLNDFLRSYGNVDVKQGEFQLYVEVAARDGRFEGYAKPFFSKVEFTDFDAKGKTVVAKIWQLAVSGLVKLFKNKERDQLATRIPFAGEFGSTSVGVWPTITSMLHHGFIEALPEELEHSVKAEAIPPPGKPLPLPTKTEPADPATSAAERKKS